MAKIGWGTPTLISARARRHHRDPRQRRHSRRAAARRRRRRRRVDPAAAGELRRRARVRQEARLVLRALFESRLLTITIDGEMGMLIAVGDDANFLMSVGGFHPQFTPPPLPFPTPKRIALNIINTDYARIRVEGLLRRHHQHRAVRRARGALLRLQRVQRRRALRVRRADALLAALPDGGGDGAAPRSRWAASACSASISTSRSKDRRRGAPAARGSVSLLFVKITQGLRRDLGRGDTTSRCRRSPWCRCCSRSSAKAVELARAAAARAAICSSRCASSSLPSRHARAASARHAARSARTRCRSASRSTRSASRRPRTPIGSRST